MTDELRERVRTLLHRQTKLGESERTLIATFLLDVLPDVDSIRELVVECDYIAEAASAAREELLCLEHGITDLPE